MPQKVLIAFDCSEGSWRAVEYVARVFGSLPDTEITLLHILSHMPPFFWDDGHILDDKEREARQAMVAQWKVRQETMCQETFARARTALVSAGIPRERVRCESRPLNTDVAGDIIDEAQNGNYDTIIIGRRGAGVAASLLIGSVTSKVVHYAGGCAVTVAA
jgi:nucleotide-binding universal stress UspA family protein